MKERTSREFLLGNTVLGLEYEVSSPVLIPAEHSPLTGVFLFS